jgi:fibronectin-binding autotransporter adhesin
MVTTTFDAHARCNRPIGSQGDSLQGPGRYAGWWKGFCAAIFLLATSLELPAANIYWGGTSDGNFQTLGNWYTNVTQTTAASALPGASDIATFNAQGTVTNAISTLGQSLALQGMLFNSNASGNITLGTLNDFVVTLGTAGISVQAGSGSHTINSGVTVGSTQSWTNNAGSNKVLTVAGNVTLSANLTLAGDTGINVTGPITATTNRTLTISNTSGAVGLGAVSTTNTQTFTVQSGAAATVNGVVSGANYHKDGAGTLTFAAANTFTGNLRILDGKVVVKASNTANHQLIFGNASGGAGSNGFGTFELDNTVADVNYRISTLYVHPTSDGAVIQSTGGAFAANLFLNATRDFIVNETASDIDLLVKVGIANGDGTARSLNKRSIGTMVMQGVNSYTGTTSIARGKLVLDYSVNNSNSRLADAAVVSMSGGNLELLANGSASSAETIGSLTLGSGTNGIKLVESGAFGVTLTFAAGISRAAPSSSSGSGVVNFELGSASLNKVVSVGGLGNDARGILGAWATVGGDRWATKNGSNEIVAHAGTVQSNQSAWVALDHVVVDAALTGTLRTAEVASLVFDAPVANNLVINNAAAALMLGSAGVLVSDDVGVNATTISGGQLLVRNATQGANAELVLTNYSTGTLSVTSHIGASNTTQSATLNLTLAGTGLIEIAGNNYYNGITNIQGNVRVSGGNAFNDYAALVMAASGQMTTLGATLNLNGSTEIVGSLQGGAATDDTYAELGRGELSLGAGGTLIVNQSSSNAFHSRISGSGTLVKRGSGTLTLSTNGNHTMTGELRVLGGLLDLTSGSEGFININTIRLRGGQLRVEQNQAAQVNKLNNSATLVLEGTSGDGYRITGNQNATRTETVNILELQGGANTFTLSHSLTASVTNNAVLTTFAFGSTATTNFVRNNGATLLVRGANLGGTASATTTATRVTFGSYTKLDSFLIGDASNSGTKRKILPFIISDGSATGAGNTFVTRDTNGLRALDVGTEYVVTYAGAAAGDNVSLNSAVAAAGTATVNALRLDGSAAGFSVTGAGGGTNVLTLTSGALLFTAGATDNDVTISGYDQILAGTADAVGDELVVFTTSTHATNPAGATLTIASQIANQGTAATAITKAGNGTLVLSHANNTYSGPTTINQGVLEFGAAGSLGSGGVVMAGGTLRWGSGNNADISSGRSVELLGTSVFLTPAGGGNILNVGNVFDVGANNVSLSGAIGNNGYGGLTKIGAGTLSLSVAPTYKGATVVAQGAMNFQTIAANTTEALYLVASSGTVSSIVESGLNVQSLIVGGVYGTAQGMTGQLTVNGGTVNIGDGSSDDFLLIGYRDASALGGVDTTSSTRGDANFSAASSVNINVSRILIGAYQGTVPTTNSYTATGGLVLSNTSNTITAGTFIIGFAPTAVVNTNTASTVNLGTGSTTINVDSWVIGGERSKATVSIGGGGSLTVRGQAGGETGANLFIGDNDMVATGTPNISSLDLTGASSVDMKLNLLVLGRIGSANGANGYGQGSLIFGTGIIEATSIRMADHDYSQAGTGATTPANTKGTITQRGTSTFRFGEMSQGTGAATYNWEAGTIENLHGRDQLNQNVTITLNGSGAATDVGLRTFSVGENQQSTFEAAAEFAGTGSFTKAGLGELILNGINLNSGNLRIAAGRVSLRSTATMDDVAWVNLDSGAAFDVKNRTASSYTTDAVISGTGVIDATGGTFTVGTGVGGTSRVGVLRPGASSVANSAASASTVGDATGTLTVLGGLNLAGDASRVDRAILQVGGTTRNIASTFSSFATVGEWVDSIPTAHASFLEDSGGNHDFIDVQGALTLNANGGITVQTTNGYTGVFGDVFNLIDWTGFANNGFTVPNRYDDGTVAGLMLDLPTLSAGLTWDTSLFLNHGTLVVTPEPSRMLLLVAGLSALALRRRRKA